MSKRLPPSQRSFSPTHDRFVAMHEAGHAVVYSLLGFDVMYCDIKRRRMSEFKSRGITNVASLHN